jgi:hypothetical protein
MKLKKLTAIALVAVAAAAVATAALAAPAAKPLTGVWAGKTHQDLAPLGDEDDFHEWEQRIVVQALRGHLLALDVNVRYSCPHPTDPRVGDIRFNLHWNVLKNNGPLLTPNGGFSLRLSSVKDYFTGRTKRLPVPVTIYGRLGAGGGGGRFEMTSRNCSGKGTFRLIRTSTI